MNSLDKLFDFTLTPRNAKERGYMYVKDIIIPTKENSSTTAYITAIHQFKIGIPQEITDEQYGLFVPESELESLAELSRKINNPK